MNIRTPGRAHNDFRFALDGATASVWLMVLSVVLLSACGQPAADDLLKQARTALAARDTGVALIKLKEAVAAKPDAAPVRAALGEALLISGDTAGALVELERARELGAADKDTATLTVRALLRSGRAKEAVERFAGVSLDAPAQQADLKAELAQAYVEIGDLAGAEQAAKAALALDAANTSARLTVARFDAAGGRNDQAAAAVDAVLRADPANVSALLLQGEMALAGGRDVAAAVAAFERALAADKVSLPAHLLLLRIAAASEETAPYEARLKVMQAALPRHPETVFAGIQLALRKSDLATAREKSQQLLLLAPEDARAQYTAALVQWRSNSLVAAESHFAKAVQLAPKAPEPRRGLGNLYVQTGNGARALQVLQPLLDNAVVRDSSALFTAGQAELQRGQAAAAEDYFKRAVAANPKDVSPRQSLALVQIARGDASGGLAELERLAAVESTDTQANLTLIATLLARRDFDRALKAVAVLESKAPGQAIAHSLRGRMLMEMGQTQGARASFERALELEPGHYPGVTGLVDLDAAAGRWPAVIERLEAHLRLVPRNYSALGRLTQARALTGVDPAKMRAELERAIQAAPNDAAPRLLLVSLLLDLRDVPGARAAAQQAVAAQPDDAGVQDALGRALLAAGDARQAVAALAKAVSLQPASAQAHLRLGDAQLRAGDVSGGRASLERARQIDPQSIDAQRAFLTLALSERRYGEALDVAREVQRRQPTAALGYLLEADVNLNQRKLPEALKLVQEAYAREPTSDLAMRVHGLQVLSNKAVDADRFAADWMKRNPKDVRFVGHLGTIALQRGDFASSEVQYRRVLELQPEEPVALNNVAWSLVQLGRAPAAVPLARRANELVPNQPAMQNTLATALKATGDLKEAADWQRRSVASSNGEPRYRLQLVEMLLATGDKEQARTELKPLEALGDNFAQRDKVVELSRQAR